METSGLDIQEAVFLGALELSKNEKKLMFSVYSSIMTKPNKRYR